jgi:hypothetical protein
MCVPMMADWFNKMEGIDPLAHALGEGLVTNDSKLIEGMAREFQWDDIAREAQYNQDNPGEGLAKASLVAGSIMAPQAVGGLGAAGGAAAGTAEAAAAAEAVAAAEAAMTAQQMGQIAMMEMVDPALMGTMQQGLLGAQQATIPSSIEGGLLGAQNVSMEAGMANTGYTPSNLYQAFNNANSANGTGLGQNLQNYGASQAEQWKNGSMFNRMAANMGDKQSMEMMKMGMKTMDGEQPPPPQSPPPRQQQGSTEPLPLPYDRVPQGMNSMMDPRYMTEEQKKRLRAMGARI